MWFVWFGIACVKSSVKLLHCTLFNVAAYLWLVMVTSTFSIPKSSTSNKIKYSYMYKTKLYCVFPCPLHDCAWWTKRNQSSLKYACYVFYEQMHDIRTNTKFDFCFFFLFGLIWFTNWLCIESVFDFRCFRFLVVLFFFEFCQISNKTLFTCRLTKMNCPGMKRFLVLSFLLKLKSIDFDSQWTSLEWQTQNSP